MARRGGKAKSGFWTLYLRLQRRNQAFEPGQRVKIEGETFAHRRGIVIQVAQDYDPDAQDRTYTLLTPDGWLNCYPSYALTALPPKKGACMQSASIEGGALILTQISQWTLAEKLAQLTAVLEQRLEISVKGDGVDQDGKAVGLSARFHQVLRWSSSTLIVETDEGQQRVRLADGQYWSQVRMETQRRAV